MKLLKQNAKPSSRRALAAVCAADSAGHTALRTKQGLLDGQRSIAAQTAASALRLEGRWKCQTNPYRRAAGYCCFTLGLISHGLN